MDIRLNDILVMKKPHPCGEKRWLVLRTGADFRLRCLGCGHEVMTPRHKAEKNIRTVERKAELKKCRRRFSSPVFDCRGNLRRWRKRLATKFFIHTGYTVAMEVVRWRYTWIW